MAEKTVFRPVRGKDERIQTLEYKDGYVYFATDTKKIYLDADGSRMPMGGNSGIYYGSKEFGDDETQVEFEFAPTDLEVNKDSEKITLPNIDDLILNLKDGGFYRVMEVSNEIISTIRLSISGSGGGGITTIARPTLALQPPFLSSNLVNGQSARIYFIATSANDENGVQLADTLTITCTLAEKQLTGSPIQYYTTTKDVTSGELSFIELTNLRESTTNVISLTASGVNHDRESPKREIVVSTSVLTLKQSSGFSAVSTYTPNNVVLKCDAEGTLPRILDFYFDEQLVETKLLDSTSLTTQSYAVPSSYCTHGAHKVRIELYYNSGSTDEPIRDAGIVIEPLKYEIAVYEVGVKDPIIWFGEYQSVYYNYDTILIPFAVYNPENMTEVVVELAKNKVVYSERTITNFTSFNQWEIANAELGPNEYSISCGNTTREIMFDVEQDPNRIMEIVNQDNLTFNFDPAGRTNQENEKNRQTYVDRNISMQFKDFNWYNNGWMAGDNHQTCLRISNGAKVEIPLGTMKFGYSNVSERSNTIEMQLKVKNIQRYANLITNITRYKKDTDYYTEFLSQTTYDNYDAFLQNKLGENYDSLEFDHVQKDININNIIGGFYNINTTAQGTQVVGICLGTQDTLFTNGGNTVNVSFVEEDMINLTYVFQYQEAEDKTKTSKLLIYINGAITGVIFSNAAETFAINDSSFIFNSSNCDIDLYKLRVYNTDLTVNDICTNYAVDRKDIKTYDQNKLASFNRSLGEFQLNYDEIDKYNGEHPNAYLMPYLIFDTSENKDSNNQNDDRLPYTKNQSAIKVKMEFVNTPLELAYQRGELEELARADNLIRKGETDRNIIDQAVKFYYEHHCPSWTSELTGEDSNDRVSLTIQGTSSQFYPRKNFKGKTKVTVVGYEEDETSETGWKEKETDVLSIYLNRGPFEQVYNADKNNVLKEYKKYYTHEDSRMEDGWYLNNYTNATDRWTFKVDYMESSGSYNAGFANMVAKTYSKHPLKDYLDAGAIEDPKNNLFSSIGDFYEEIGRQDAQGGIKWSDYRTSMEGFPVMAFHKKSDGTCTFIGYYRMLTDKSSDAIVGFKPNKNVVSTIMKKNGKKMKVRDLAECWEFSANNRKFCSFRDPENRVQLSFKGTEGGKEEFNGELAPWVVENFEYRYHRMDDALDQLYTFASTNQADLEALFNDIRDDLGITDPNELPTPQTVTDKDNPTSEDKANARLAQNATLKYYANWERACQWVWSTNMDNVASEGDYSLIALGKQVYQPNKFYIYDETTSQYKLATDATAQEDATYYERITHDDGSEDSYTDAYICSADLVYKKDTYYTKSVIQGKDRYTLSSDEEFSGTEEYYKFTEYSNEELANKADLLVAPATGDFNSAEIYYTYDPSAIVNPEGPSGAVQKVETPVAEDIGKYYVASPVTYGTRTYHYDTKEYRATKFRYELTKHFDPEYMATYFIMTEIFECYDSRGKNCMMASWGPLEEDGDYIWYPIFYDIDTQLGINNSGIPSFEFNVDATDSNNFSTSDSVLWNNFYTMFKNSYILNKYQWLRDSSTGPLSTVDKIEGWYNFDADTTGNIACKGQKPLIATNLDMYYKYITITNPNAQSEGVAYLNGSGVFETDSGGTYFYALQGDRQQSRKQFLTNRIEYIDSWLNQGNYARGGNNNIRGRISANNMDRNTHSDWWVETTSDPYWVNNKEFSEKTHEFDAEYWVNFTPVRSSYVTLGGDGNATYPSQKYDGVNPVQFKITEVEHGVRTSPNYPEQLIYLYGMNQMKDLGDLSKLYWAEFIMSGSFNKLTSLRLGYDGLDKSGNKWYNRGLINLNSLQDMPLLKEMNLSNLELREQTTLNLRKSEKLENFRATGASKIQVINFAEGVALSTLYYPSCATNLELIEANLLRDLMTEYKQPTIQDGKLVADSGLYIEGFFEGINQTLSNINIVGDSLKENSYKILKQFYKLHKGDTSSPRVTMQEVNWCPLTAVGEGETYNASLTYYKDNGHYGFEPYSYDIDTYNNLVANGELYEGTLPDEYLINDREDAENSGFKLFKALQDSSNTFLNTTGTSKPYISGIVYIDNDTPIEESEIYELQNAYPKLTFFLKSVTKAYSAKFLSYDGETKSYQYVKFQDANITKPSVQKISVSDFLSGNKSFENPLNLYKPDKVHYDFLGWCRNADGSGIVYNQDTPWTEIIEQDNYDYTYYAIYKLHQYEMSFYNWDGTGEPIEVIKVEYGSTITTPNAIPYKDDSGLGLYEAYDFNGYSLTIGGEKIAVEKMTATSDRKFYAIFKTIKDIRDTIHEEWFDFVDTEYTKDTQARTWNTVIEDIDDRCPSPIIPNTEGYSIKIKESLILRGKITIPLTHNKKPVLRIGDNFGVGSQITHVFMANSKDEQCQVYEIGNSAFANVTSLKYFDFTTVRSIEQSAFIRCTGLDLDTFKLGNNTYWCSNTVFQGAFTFKGDQTLVIPSEMRYVGQRAFTNFGCINKKYGNVLQLGTPEKASKLVFEYPNLASESTQKFQQNANNNKPFFDVIRIYSNTYTSENQQIGNSSYQVDSYFNKNSQVLTYEFLRAKED